METECSVLCLQQPATGHYPEPNQSRPFPPILVLLRPIFILCFNLHLSHPSDVLPSGFLTKTLNVYPPPFPHACNISCTFHTPADHPNNTEQPAKIVKLLSMQFSPASC